MIISIHQPAYLPWLGYFDKIIKSDIFIILDTVDYQKNSYQNRNKVLSKNGCSWLTIPLIKDNKSKLIKDIKISYKYDWQNKHLKTIKQNYSKADYFQNHINQLSLFYENKWDNFNHYCYEMLQYFCSLLNIKKKIILLSNDANIPGKKSELILNLCKNYNATTYYSGINGKNYLNQTQFDNNNIKIIYQNYKYKKYKQINSNSFISNLSIIDLMMNSDNISEYI